MLASVKRFALVLAVPFFAACGSSYDTVKVKHYTLSIVEGDKSLAGEIKQLIADYNQMAGMTVLNYSDDPSQANSPIIIVNGLEAQTGDKVGLGQWLSETETESPLTGLGGRAKQTVTYSMRIQFDRNYMSTLTHYDHQKLFFHEVGHGLEMDHIQNDPSEVMYPDVDGNKNFPKYFERVRAYMSDT